MRSTTYRAWRAIGLFAGVTGVGVVLFYWGLQVAREGQTVLGVVLLTAAILVVVFGRRWIGPPRGDAGDGQDAPSRYPWPW